MPCGVVELGGRLCESTHTISKEDGSMWGVVFAFASVWCPEPSPAATDDDEGPNRSKKETCVNQVPK